VTQVPLLLLGLRPPSPVFLFKATVASATASPTSLRLEPDRPLLFTATASSDTTQPTSLPLARCRPERQCLRPRCCCLPLNIGCLISRIPPRACHCCLCCLPRLALSDPPPTSPRPPRMHPPLVRWSKSLISPTTLFLLLSRMSFQVLLLPVIPLLILIPSTSQSNVFIAELPNHSESFPEPVILATSLPMPSTASSARRPRFPHPLKNNFLHPLRNNPT